MKKPFLTLDFVDMHKEYVLKADMPGIPADSIHVDILKNNRLTIKVKCFKPSAYILTQYVAGRINNT